MILKRNPSTCLLLYTMNRILLVLLCFSSFLSQAQSGYRLGFQVEGWKDTTVLLAYYNGEQTLRRDTARVDKKGTFFFEGSKPLLQGLYLLAVNNTRQFEFVVGEDQVFDLHTRTDDYYAHMKVQGDQDNQLYFENLAMNKEKFALVEPFLKVLKDSAASEVEKTGARTRFEAERKAIMTYQDNLIKKYPKTLTARMLLANREIEIPEAPLQSDGTPDPAFRLNYYRAHYFDHFDLRDDALLRIREPLYAKKVTDYLDRLFVQHPDTLFQEVKRLATLTKGNLEAYKYLVWACLTHYQSHNIMGLDGVYVKIFDTYVATGEMDYWLDKNAKQSIKEYVDKVRLSLIGNTAPNLIMQDQNLQPKALYDLRSQYTIVYFFRPTCGHCREETPKLVDFYNKKKKAFDLEVFAVDTDSSLANMKKFQADMKTPWITVSGPRTYVGRLDKLYHVDLTPTIYIIDNRKKIIAKKLNIDQLEDFLTKYSALHPKS